jgi:hypothetical protein
MNGSGGTCDKGCWTKSLEVATDAAGYGFCLGVSKVVRLLGGFSVAISKVDWSCGAGWEAVELNFCVIVSAGLGWVAVSGDTIGIGAEARAVESRMDGLLGRVKS